MAKSVFQLFLLLLFLSLSAGAMGQQTLHFIASIDQVNDDVSKGCAKDYQEALTLFGAIAKDAGMRFNHQKLPFDQGSVESYLERFTCGSDDVVVFLFSGHGFRYEDDDEEWPWPYLFYCNREQSGADTENCEVDMDWVQEAIIDRNPRLSIVLGDCCNNVQHNPEANETLNQLGSLAEDVDPNSTGTYAKLDLIRSFRGSIIASAAKPGQQAETNDESGSHFFGAFRYHLLNALQSQQPTSWESILGNTRNMVMQLSNNQQTPLFCVNGRCY